MRTLAALLVAASLLPALGASAATPGEATSAPPAGEAGTQPALAAAERAEEAYVGGDLAGAVAAARAALTTSLPAPLEARVHAVLAAVRSAEGSESGASDELVEAFAADPLLALDPVLFPPDVRALAERVRTERRDDIQRRHAERVPPTLTPTPVTPPSPRDEPPSLALAFVPFGTGQFQNDQPTKGAILASLEGLAVIAAVGGLATSLSLRDADGRYAQADASTARTLNVVYLAGAYGFLALHAYGVTDSLLSRDAGP